MGDLKDRRAQKKAQTRAQILRVAQHLFAEHGFESVTIADIARQADVAVQTVFNHFATKEDLFFSERAEWVDGAAIAVRSRAPGVQPATTLREHFLGTIRRYLVAMQDADTRAVLATLDASPALRAYERELHQEAVQKLAAALVDTCPEAGSELPGATPSMTLRAWASLTASVWFAAVRGLLIEQRTELVDPCRAAHMSAVVERLAEQVLAQLEATTAVVDCAPGGDPQPVRSPGWGASARWAG